MRGTGLQDRLGSVTLLLMSSYCSLSVIIANERNKSGENSFSKRANSMLVLAKSITIVWSPGESCYSWAIKTLGFNYLTLWKCIPGGCGWGGCFIYSTPNQRLKMWGLISFRQLSYMCVGRGWENGEQGGLGVAMLDAFKPHVSSCVHGNGALGDAERSDSRLRLCGGFDKCRRREG